MIIIRVSVLGRDRRRVSGERLSYDGVKGVYKFIEFGEEGVLQ